MAWRSGNRHQDGGWILPTTRRLRLRSHSRFRRTGGMPVTRVCIVGASGKLGRYMVRHALDRGYEVVGVCRAQSVAKLDAFKERMTIISWATDDRQAIRKAVAGCDGILAVLVPEVSRGTRTVGTADYMTRPARPTPRPWSCRWPPNGNGSKPPAPDTRHGPPPSMTSENSRQSQGRTPAARAGPASAGTAGAASGSAADDDRMVA